MIKTKNYKPYTDQSPQQIINKIRDGNKSRRRWQKTRLKRDKSTVDKQTKEIRIEINKYRNKKWNQKLSELNPNDKTLWNMTKILKRKFNKVPTLINNRHECFRQGFGKPV